MTYRERIETKLTEAFRPAELVIEDESHKHRGHVGHRPEGETHFHVRIVSDVFAGQSRVNRQRAIYRELKSELEERVHALSLEVLTPDEAA
jgi:BolA protein